MTTRLARCARAAAQCMLLSLLAAGGGTAVQAHEIGTTRVTALFHDNHRYEIQIVTDAASLVDKLEAMAGPEQRGLPATAATASGVGRRLTALDEIFRQRVVAAFDGVASRPAIHYTVSSAVDAASPMLVTVRLTGETPVGARQFTWTYSWIFASYALSVRNASAPEPATEWLEGNQTSTPFSLATAPPAVNARNTAWRYLTLGFTHIVPHGLDHMLFVLGIFLLSGRVRSVITQVSAFTVAHSITLGLSIYGVIAVPAALVEPLIAVSIAYVATENLLLTELKPRRIALVFAFGLLHGMGFAGALRELGLPRSQFLTALLTFNVGVEAGQLAVIATAFALVGWRWRDRVWYRRRIVMPASMAIACTAIYWTVARIAF